MKTVAGFTLFILVLGTAAGSATAGQRHYDGWGRHHGGYGRVVGVRPIYTTVEVAVPETRCTESYLTEVIADPDQAALTGAVTGGIVGGIAGDQIGQGTERSVLTVAGAVAGAAIGYKAGPSVAEWFPATEWLPGDCGTVEQYETRDELVGYHVKYRYRGHIYHTRTIEHPGDRIRVDRRERRHRF